MCDHENREAAMVIIDPGTPERHGRDGVWCDPCLEPVVRALNDGGMRTIASCCGHGTNDSSIALADGRWIVITSDAPDAYAHRSMTGSERREFAQCSTCQGGPVCYCTDTGFATSPQPEGRES